ncbi:MAG: hypothetical protein PUE01_06970 [Clostridiaceae bacterium]|nr:hypothetical protein [Clostridiaceae bacterium]
MRKEWTKEYKAEIGKRYLINRGIPSKDDLKELNIQQLAFLIQSAHHFHEQKLFFKDDFIEKANVFKENIIDKIRDIDYLYILYSRITGYPFILPNNDYVLIYSKEKYANEAKENYKKQNIIVDVKKINNKNIIKLFTELYRIGGEKIVIDMCDGIYGYTFNRSEILDKPDYRMCSNINMPFYNPELQKLMLVYKESLKYKNLMKDLNYVRTISDKLIIKILESKFLIPIKIDKQIENIREKTSTWNKNKINNIYAILQDKKTLKLTPIFTDWEEFMKLYDLDSWNGKVVTYKEAFAIADEGGVIINAKGAAIKVDVLQKQCIIAD